MKIEYDDDKNEINIRVRGLEFSLVREFDFEGAVEVDQIVDGELRHLAFGLIGTRLHALVYTIRGDAVRVVSLRKANKREVKRYEKYCKP